jgi:hypothetical protein
MIVLVECDELNDKFRIVTHVINNMKRAKEGNYDDVVSRHKVIRVETCFKRDCA